MSRTAPIVTPRSTPLTMSYTVSAATDAAVMASISTPVWPVVAASARIRSNPPARSGVIETCRSVSGKRVAERDQVAGLLAAHDAGELRHAEDVALGAAAVDDQAERLGRHRHRRLGDGASRGDGLVGHVDHARPAATIDVGEAAALGARGERSAGLGVHHDPRIAGVTIARERVRRGRATRARPRHRPAGCRRTRG